jgi:hypothetical protein
MPRSAARDSIVRHVAPKLIAWQSLDTVSGPSAGAKRCGASVDDAPGLELFQHCWQSAAGDYNGTRTRMSEPAKQDSLFVCT